MGARMGEQDANLFDAYERIRFLVLRPSQDEAVMKSPGIPTCLTFLRRHIMALSTLIIGFCLRSPALFVILAFINVLAEDALLESLQCW